MISRKKLILLNKNVTTMKYWPIRILQETNSSYNNIIIGQLIASKNNINQSGYNH